MKKFFQLSVLLVLTLLTLGFWVVPAQAATNSFSHTHHNLLLTAGCHYTTCDGKLENAVNPPCASDQVQYKEDGVTDQYGNFVGDLYLFVSPGCASFWGGFKNSAICSSGNPPATMSGVSLSAGNYNTQDVHGPVSGTLGCNSWFSSFMDENDLNCKSIWVSGLWWFNSDPFNAKTFSHKLIYGGTGC